jgi:MFS family permease
MVYQGQTRVLILLLVGVFMGSLDIGIVGPALPSLGTYFGLMNGCYPGFLTIYILFFMIGTQLMAN